MQETTKRLVPRIHQYYIVRSYHVIEVFQLLELARVAVFQLFRLKLVGQEEMSQMRLQQVMCPG